MHFWIFSVLKLRGKLVEVVMATFGEVGLQNLSKQISFQQAVRHGENLSDNLVEILWKRKKKKKKWGKHYLSSIKHSNIMMWTDRNGYIFKIKFGKLTCEP